MKITKRQLKKLIREELELVNEKWGLFGKGKEHTLGPAIKTGRSVLDSAISGIVRKAHDIWGAEVDDSSNAFAINLLKKVFDETPDKSVLINKIPDALPQFVAVRLCQEFDGRSQAECWDNYTNR
jgi:hypothetical protein